jgi:thiol:disulfide interchange protein DsbD
MTRLLLTLLLALLPLTAPAAENPLKVRLISESSTIAPGKPFRLGLHLNAPDGFHSYWKHPGIVGYATRAKWTLPPGFTAGEIQWPAPQLVKMAEYTAQGYRGETLLIIPITPPATITTDTVTIDAKVSWMCCSNSCHHANNIPFTITLPVADSPSPDPATATLFATSDANTPKPDPTWSTSFVRNEKSITLTLKPADPENARPIENLGTVRFFTADGQIDTDQPQTSKILPDGTLQLTLHLSDIGPKNPSSLPGLLHAQNGWHKNGGPSYIEIK